MSSVVYFCTLSKANPRKMAEQNIDATFSRYDVRVVIKFSTLLGKSAVETHGDLCKVMGNNAPSIQTVRKWIREVEGGRSDLKDETHTGRPPVVICGDSVGRIKAVVEEDTRRTCREISEIVGMSSATVHRILTNGLGKKKSVCKVGAPFVDTRAETGPCSSGSALFDAC